MRRRRAAEWLVVVIAVLVSGACAAVRAAPVDEVPRVAPESAPAGALAALPARGLAAAIAEAGRIEVPAGDPADPLAIRATQASRWTEGAYDVWHLTGGVRIMQGETLVSAHEAVVWIEQPHEHGSADGSDASGPKVRTVLVRMAGEVHLRSGGEDGAGQIRGPRWAGRFWTLRDPELDFAKIGRAHV